MPVVRQTSPKARTPVGSPGLDRHFRDELLKVIYERKVNCPECGYSLNGVVGTRCPECGLGVEEYLRVYETMPARWAKYRASIRTRRLQWAAFGISVLMVGAAAAAVVFRW